MPPSEGVESQPKEVLRHRLRNRLAFWKKIGATPTVLKWIQFGYDVPLIKGTEPPRWHQRNLEGAEEYSHFLDERLPELLAVGAIQRCEVQPHGVSPLNVVPKATPGKFRLILDLRFLNKYLAEFSFKMETLHRRRHGFLKNDHMFNLDLESGYYHVRVRKADRKYLGFLWRGQYYEFCVLPFGLSSAPAAFTKVMKQLANYWRNQGIRLLFYLDDWCFMHQNKEEAKALVARILRDMEQAGLLINKAKSVLRPTTRLKLLGFWIDSVEGSFRIPPERKKKIMDHLRELMDKRVRKVHVRALSSTAGRIMSCHLALGKVTRLFTRAMYICIESRSSWSGTVSVSAQVRQEAAFWYTSLDEWDGAAIWPQQLHNPLILMVDASDEAWGGFLENGDSLLEARERFTEEEAADSSTRRELLGLERLLQTMEQKLMGHHALVYTDSYNTQLIFSHGSPKPWLNDIAVRIFKFCVRCGIFLMVRWIPREENVHADMLSKVHSPDDWRVSKHIFEHLDREWGPHDIDRMAASGNALLPRFNSLRMCRDTEAVDCFTQNWSGANNWVCPPFHLIEQVLRHIRMCEAEATLIVPCWTSAAWWPLVRHGATWAPCVEGSWYLPRVAAAFVPDHGEAMMGNQQHSFDVVALRVSFA